MPEKRRLVLRREQLTELSEDVLEAIAAAGPTFAVCTIVWPTGCGCFGSCGPKCTAISSHPD